MKKNIFFIIALIFYSNVSLNAQCAENSQEFIKKFSTCSYYVDNGERRISAVLGWSTRKCYYREISNFEQVSCGFKQLELLDVANAMRRENFNPANGITSLKTIDNYLYYSPDVCKVEKQHRRRY